MLKDTSAAAPIAAEGPAPRNDLDNHDGEQQAALEAPPLPEPPASLAALEPVQLTAASEPAQAACADNCVSPQGVSPMLRIWRTSVLPTFVLAALTTPALAGAETTKDRLKAIEDQLKEMKESLKKSFDQVGKDIKAINEDIKALADARKDLEVKVQKQISDLQTDLNALKRRLSGSDLKLYPAADAGALEELRSRLAQMERTLERLQAPPTRMAFSAPRTSQLVVVNTYNSDMLFVVNGVEYRVNPGQTFTLTVPAGTLTYEAIAPGWGIVRPRTTTTLAPGETLTLTASLR
jgi:hypothetical protein